MIKLAAFAFLVLSVPASAQRGPDFGAVSWVHPLIAIVRDSAPAVRQELLIQIGMFPHRTPFHKAIFARNSPELAQAHPVKVQAAKLMIGLLASRGIVARHASVLDRAFGDVDPESRSGWATRHLVLWGEKYEIDPDAVSHRRLGTSAPGQLRTLRTALGASQDAASARAALDAAWDNVTPGSDRSSPHRPWDNLRP